MPVRFRLSDSTAVKTGMVCHGNHCMELIVCKHSSHAIHECRLKPYNAKKNQYMWTWSRNIAIFSVPNGLKWKTVLWSEKSRFEIIFGKHGLHILWIKKDRDHPVYDQTQDYWAARILYHAKTGQHCSHKIQQLVSSVPGHLQTVVNATQ